MSLQGKTLFITGASRGIGLAIGLRAARDGANVVIADWNEEEGNKMAQQLNQPATSNLAFHIKFCNLKRVAQRNE